MKLRLRGCTVGAGVANGIAPEGRCGGPPGSVYAIQSKMQASDTQAKSGEALAAQQRKENDATQQNDRAGTA